MNIDVEPLDTTLVARQSCHLLLTIRASEELSPGDTVEAQFPHTWLLVSGPSFTRDLQAERPEGEHYIGVSAEGARFRTEIRPRQLNFPEGLTRHGRHMVATLEEGRVPGGAPVTLVYANTYAPYVSDTETLWLRVKGEAPAEPPRLKVTGVPEERLRVIAPSGVEPGQPFEVLVASLDRFDNASSTRYQGMALTRSDGEVVAGGLDFRGTVRVPASIQDEGVYRFRFAEAVSNAVRVARGARGPYWGDIHIHTKLSMDGQGTDPYDYARDVAGLDFAATADHWQSLGPEGYRVTAEWARAANEPGRFVTIPADERNPEGWTGHHNVYFADEEMLLKHAALEGCPDPLSPEKAGAEPPQPGKVMVIPHHTGLCFSMYTEGKRGCAVDLDAVDDRGLRPSMEIYSHHGQSEAYSPGHVLAYEFNRMRTPSRRANTSVPGPHYAQDYWMAGRRLGVIGSSDEHSGQGGRPHGGVAAVRAGDLTREAIFEAIRNRRTYATTGERMLVEFDVDGLRMGEEGERPRGARLNLRLSVWGTDLLLFVDILRFRPGLDKAFRPIASIPPRPESMDAVVEAEDILEGPAIYYGRITQNPLDWPGMAWTSPVWVDVD